MLRHPGSQCYAFSGTVALLLTRADGSWTQLLPVDGDACATATALTALRAAGLPAADTAYRNGVAYSLKTQRDEGAWFVQTRARFTCCSTTASQGENHSSSLSRRPAGPC